MNRKIRYTVRGMALLWMMVIFAFSARPADLSSQDSLWAGKKIGYILTDDFGEWEKEEQTAFAEKISFPVRKGAHMAEYAILGILLFGSWDLSRTGLKKPAVFSWGLGTIYAATDEFHQLFVAGRSGQMTDVMIDSAGVLSGVVLSVVIAGCVLCRRQYSKTGRSG